MLSAKEFRQSKPCADCPFKKVGSSRHGVTAAASYLSYFTESPAITFPCHKSVAAADDRAAWSEWQEGQTICAGGLLFAEKIGQTNAIGAIACELGWAPADGAADEVFSSKAEMLLAHFDE